MQLLAGVGDSSTKKDDNEDMPDGKRKHSSPTKDAELASPPPKDSKTDKSQELMDTRIC